MSSCSVRSRISRLPVTRNCLTSRRWRSISAACCFFISSCNWNCCLAFSFSPIRSKAIASR